MTTPVTPARSSRARTWILGLGPLVILAGLVALFLRFGPLGVFRAAFPPVEELTIERVLFPTEDLIEVRVVNGGPQAVTVSQVMVDEAYWMFQIRPGATIPRLGRATVTLAYPWVAGEPLEIKLVSSTGLTFAEEVAVATESPRPDARYFSTFTLLGVYAGVVPVFLGLLWYPFLRGVSRRWMHFFLSLTVGLLIFLAVDALHEALETAARVPAAFQGVGLVALGTLGAILALVAVGRWLRAHGRGGDARRERLSLAYLIALGIGLHNLGEGLAIGAAYAIGEIALGAFLVIGFAIHNTTEGFGIVAPVAQERPAVAQLALMGALAGVPTILGTWIGGFTYSPILATAFLALGAGAILQVVYEIGRLIARETEAGWGAWASVTNAAGLVLGLVIMYSTALLVVA
ncbi:MAG: metal transporter [Gemmatimonadetes bacterium]|nr:metal transporter [Gemmatimonadota bacterium]